MAFTFKERDIRVAIGNNWYVIHMGNASMLDAVAKAKKALNDLDINESGDIEAGDSPARTVSGLLRDYVGRCLAPRRRMPSSRAVSLIRLTSWSLWLSWSRRWRPRALKPTVTAWRKWLVTLGSSLAA